MTTPDYVHKLLDALLLGVPLDLKKEPLPDDVRERLEQAVKDGQLQEVPIYA